MIRTALILSALVAAPAFAAESDAAADAAIALEALARPLTILGQRLEAMIADPPDWLDGSARARVEGATASLSWRIDTLRAWISMLARAVGPIDPEYVDWLAIDRFEGREMDIGGLSQTMLPALGYPLAVTSADRKHKSLIRNTGPQPPAFCRSKTCDSRIARF
mgnify:CR=1 FL=1